MSPQRQRGFKSGCDPQQRTKLRFGLIENNLAQFEVKIIYQVLQVSRNGYYVWRKRPKCVREYANCTLSQLIQAIHAQSRESYGVRRLPEALVKRIVLYGKHRVARLMRAADLNGKDRARHY